VPVAKRRASKGDGPALAAGPFILRGLRCAPAPQDDGIDIEAPRPWWQSVIV